MSECTECQINKLKQKLNEQKRKEKEYEFDEFYEKYISNLKEFSSGLVESNKAEFLKQYAFFSVVTAPVFEDYMKELFSKLKY